jgi:hypothetical protein
MVFSRGWLGEWTGYEIGYAEFRGFVEEENDGMDDGEGEGNVAGDVVEAEIVEVAMRPLADGTVAEDHQRTEQHVDGYGAHGGETDIGGEVQDSDVGGHCGVGRRRTCAGNARRDQWGSYRERRSL